MLWGLYPAAKAATAPMTITAGECSSGGGPEPATLERLVRTAFWLGRPPSMTQAKRGVHVEAGVNQRIDYRRQVLHTHQDHKRGAAASQGIPVQGAARIAGGRVAGDHRETLRDAAVSQRYAGQLGCRDGRRDAGDDLDRDSGLRAGDDLFHAAAEHERVPALEPDHDPALHGPRLTRMSLISSWGVNRPRGIFETSMISTPSRSPSRTANGASRSTTTTSASAKA